MAGAGAKRAAWNAALLSGGVAPAYLRLLTAAAEVSHVFPSLGVHVLAPLHSPDLFSAVDPQSSALLSSICCVIYSNC